MKEPLPTRVEHRIDTHLSVAQRMREKTGTEHVAPFVTVSRQYGCEAMQFADALAEALARAEHVPTDHWPVYSRQIIEQLCEEAPLAERLLDALDIRTRSGIEEFFETLVGRAPTDIELLRRLVHTLRALAHHGRCIMVGRGGALLTAGIPGGLHVRLIAPEAWRLKNLIGRFGWDEHKARTLLHEEEHGRQNFFHKYLGRDASDPEHYDLVLNAATLGRDEQVAAVTALFQKRFPLHT